MEPLSKPLQAAAELDHARCYGDWALVPELARRYKKYHPDETVIVESARYEAIFSLFVMKQRNEDVTSKGERASGMEPAFQYHRETLDAKVDSTGLLTPLHHKDKSASNRRSIWGSANKSTTQVISPPIQSELPVDSDALHCNDDPHHISLAPRLDPAQTEKYLKAFRSIIEKHTRSGQLETKDDRQAQLAKIIVARIYFETGRYAKALESLERLALRMEDVHSGYGMVLLVQARVIKAICFEMQGDIDTALETYEAAWDVFDQHPAEKGEMLSFWIEECLYRAILLHMRTNGPARRVLPLMRGYMHLASSHWSSFWRMHKRWIIFSHYGRYLVKTCQDGTYYPMPIAAQAGSRASTVNLSAEKKTSQASAYEELLCLTALYRNLLSSITARVGSKQRSRYVLELANFFYDTHNVIGWGEISNIRRVLQFFQRAKEHTFNSTTISRYIFFTLMRLGNYEEAGYAFRSYMELMGLPDIDKTDENGVEITPYAELDIASRIEHIIIKLKALRQIAESRPDDSSTVQENENEINVIEVLLAGIQLYGRELRYGKLAAFLGDLAVELVSNLDPALSGYTPDEWMAVVAACHRMRGTSYGLFAIQAHDPEKRATYHGEALASLTKASDIDNHSWKIYYEIALQQAQMKDIGSALKSIGRSLQLKPDHLASWHLLSLINSCTQIRQIPQALQTIQAGLETCGSNIEIPTNITYGMPVLSWNIDEKHSRAYHDRSEAYLRLRITQLEFLEALEGPDAALNGFADLFSTYTHLAQSLGMSEAQAAVKAGENLKRIASIKTDASKASTNTVSSPAPILEEPPSSPKSTRSSRAKSITAMDSVRRFSTSSSKRNTVDHSTDSVPPLPSADEKKGEELKGRRKSTETVRSTKDKSRKKNVAEPVKRPSSSLTSPPVLGRQSRNSSRLSIKLGSTAEELRRDSAPADIIAPSGMTPSFSVASMRSSSMSSTISLVSTSTAFSTTTTASSSNNNVSAFVRNQRERWHQLLVKLWLMSTNSFIKSKRFEEASKAIVEAEQLGIMDAVVWHQLGNLCFRTYKDEEPDNKELLETALDAYKKALMLEPDHVRTHIDLASAYIDVKEWELAEALLERVTKGPGWDQPEAWYMLGTVYKEQELFEHAKNCLLYAVELNDATPMGTFTELPRFV